MSRAVSTKGTWLCSPERSNICWSCHLGIIDIYPSPSLLFLSLTLEPLSHHHLWATILSLILSICPPACQPYLSASRISFHPPSGVSHRATPGRVSACLTQLGLVLPVSSVTLVRHLLAGVFRCQPPIIYIERERERYLYLPLISTPFATVHLAQKNPLPPTCRHVGLRCTHETVPFPAPACGW